MQQLFIGNFVCCESFSSLVFLKGFIIIQDGKITRKGTLVDLEELKGLIDYNETKVINMKPHQFMMPGLVDCHVHAPQFPNLGVGLDKPLLEWLENYTLPLESKYSDTKYASTTYDKVVRRLIKNGTTTASYFATIHLNATLELCRIIQNLGQRALVGKVNTNIPNKFGYFKETKIDIEETEAFILSVNNLKNKLIEPVITPRFALSCDKALMKELAHLANKYNCRVQSHISENLGEIAEALKLFPDCKSYADIYDKCNLLNSKCIMAHAVHLGDEEILLLAQRKTSVAHCPASNTRLLSGLCPVRKLLNRGITTGLGTDVSGGDSPSILDAMRRALDVSAHLQLQGDHGSALTWKEAFYMATLGGAKALNLDEDIGDFTVGKSLDALLVDVYGPNSSIDVYTGDVDIEEIVQRFIYLGDDRNIIKVYINGVERKDNL